MRLSRLVLAGTLAFTVSGAGGAVPPGDLPGDLVRSCLTQLRALSKTEGHSEAHSFDLRKRCPRLASRLAAMPDIVDGGALEIDATSIEGLRDLQSFAAGFHRQPATGRFSPDYDGLDALVAEVLIVDEDEDDFWKRFQRWLEQYARDTASPGLERFAKWLNGLDPPPWLGDVLLVGLIVLIVLLALIVIGNEIRLAGLFRRKWRHRETRPEAAAPPPASPRPVASLDELRGLPPRQLAAAVLAFVTAAFVERGWLSASASLTNGELVRQVGQSRREVAGAFTGLVTGIEKVIYGDRLPDDDVRRQLFDTARELTEGARTGASTGPAGRR